MTKQGSSELNSAGFCAGVGDRTVLRYSPCHGVSLSDRAPEAAAYGCQYRPPPGPGVGQQSVYGGSKGYAGEVALDFFMIGLSSAEYPGTVRHDPDHL
eukprot:763042-Hanusia_phi.AAC.10